VLLHSWHGAYEKECVPAWDYYPVLEAVAARHVLLYPSATLDQLHSEKRYRSALMPPTRCLRLSRGTGSKGAWQVQGSGSSRSGSARNAQQTVPKATEEALAQLRQEALAAGLPPGDVMVKQGLSWGGEAVTRLGPKAVAAYIKTKVLPKAPAQAKSLTILLQAKVDLVAELRWVILDGKLRGRGWRTFQKAGRGKSMSTAGMKGEQESREALAAAGLAQDEAALLRLEESMRSKVELVLAEAVADAGGQVPQFLRVDLLIDSQGRAWLGERESWGADLMKDTCNRRTRKFTRQDPSRTEVAAAMIARASRSAKLGSTKRKALGREAPGQKVSFRSKTLGSKKRKAPAADTAARKKRQVKRLL